MGVCFVCGRDDVCDDCAMFNRLDDGSGRSWYEVPLFDAWFAASGGGSGKRAGQVVHFGGEKSGPSSASQRHVSRGLTPTKEGL